MVISLFSYVVLVSFAPSNRGNIFIDLVEYSGKMKFDPHSK